MSKVNHRTNGKKYDKRGHERHEGWAELFIDHGEWINAWDYPLKKKCDRRKARHTPISTDDD